MPVSLLLITHNGVGAALLEAAATTFGALPLLARAISVDYNIDPEHILPKLSKTARRIDQGEGMLILTDILGATPSNLAHALPKILTRSNKAIIVAGLNLPMLIRVINYANLDLKQLAQKALSGGREGVCNCANDQEAAAVA